MIVARWCPDCEVGWNGTVPCWCCGMAGRPVSASGAMHKLVHQQGRDVQYRRSPWSPDQTRWTVTPWRTI